MGCNQIKAMSGVLFLLLAALIVGALAMIWTDINGMIGNGPIPITHSINFYNKLLNDIGEKDKTKFVSDKEKLFLLEYRKALGNFGSISGRKVFLLKESNSIRLTLFDGGHEILKRFAFEQITK